MAGALSWNTTRLRMKVRLMPWQLALCHSPTARVEFWLTLEATLDWSTGTYRGPRDINERLANPRQTH
eukprot:1211669-Alexandrium_andersonii.AAC.1